MPSKIILTLCLLHFSIQVQSQNIDTLINGIEYSMVKDTTSNTAIYSFTIKNRSEKRFTTGLFGLSSNKTIIHNSSNQRVDYDLIICGEHGRVNIEPDSSYSWVTELFKITPENHTFISSKKIDRTDSLYLVFWVINKSTIGPIQYYLEKDLVTNLYNSDHLIRDRSAKLLRTLFDKKMTVVKTGHSFENSLAYWKKKYAILKKGISIADLKRETDLNITRGCAYGKFPDVVLQLDNSYCLTIEFDERAKVKKYDIFYKPKKAFYGRNKPKNGTVCSYYINGRCLTQESFLNGKIHGKQFLFNKDGQLLSESTYDTGKRIETIEYNSTGKLYKKVIYFERKNLYLQGDRKEIHYDETGKVLRQKFIKGKKKKKRVYK